MSVIKNSTTVTSISYNSVDISEGIYDDITVFTSDGYVVIQSSAFLETDVSFVPPPYDENGYNYNASAPKKEAELTIALGDITSYDHISFDFNNEGSSNSYGYVLGTATINNVTVTIFNSLNQNGTIDIDTSELAGEYSLKLKLEAKSNSSYRGYRTKAVLNASNIRGVFDAPVPVSQDGFTINTGDSRVPPPYDENGYNYSALAPEHRVDYTFDFGDVTNYNTVAFSWQNYDDTTHSGNTYGEVYAKYIDINGIDQYLYSKNLSTISDTSGSVTIDTSDISGHLSLTFTAYARSKSSYGGAVSRAVLKVLNIQMSQ